jgi:glutathione peroxidase
MGNSIYNIEVKDIIGKDKYLREYQGKVLLIVNTASQCGLTGQYKELEELYQRYKDQGLVILAFPCNQFAQQESGSNKEILEFCKTNYGITFPLFSRLEVNGKCKHELYDFLTGDTSRFPGEIQWNFTKFIISKTGQILERFDPDASPLTSQITSVIEKALN